MGFEGDKLEVHWLAAEGVVYRACLFDERKQQVSGNTGKIARPDVGGLGCPPFVLRFCAFCPWLRKLWLAEWTAT